MINTTEQEELFTLISKYLEKDVTCYAIGGTAMMFYRYKNTTKDIDLVFSTQEERSYFVAAIMQLGYREGSLKNIYDEKRRSKKNVPLMYTRGEERFDLFVRDVFGFLLPPHLETTQQHDFPQHLTINILPIEYLVLLKAITRREKDHEDIETILSFEKNLDWNNIIMLAIEQQRKNKWILIDLEETLTKLKAVTFIPGKFFNMIYAAQEKK